MSSLAPSRRTLRSADAALPALIAHGAGNSLDLAAGAVAAGADFAEIDLWVHLGAFEARHERRFVRPIPLLFEKWYIKGAPRHPLGLAGLFERLSDGTGVFLDLKNGVDAPAGLVRDAMRATGWSGPLVASAQHWPSLRALRRQLPGVPLFYSIDGLAKLDLFLSVMQHDGRPAGVSCRHTLLSPGLIDRLHQHGLEVVAWTVDDVGRAAELAGWGVDGLTTHNVAALREQLAAR